MEVVIKVINIELCQVNCKNLNLSLRPNKEVKSIQKNQIKISHHQ